MARPKGSKNKSKTTHVNWEDVAKKLQAALNSEIAENLGMAKTIKQLEFQVANAAHKEIGYQAVISYLESKRGNNPI